MSDPYIGSTVKLIKVPRQIEVFGKPLDLFEYQLDPDNPVIDSLKALYPKVRFWLPGQRGTGDYVSTRVNVHIAEGPEGVFTITQIDRG